MNKLITLALVGASALAVTATAAAAQPYRGPTPAPSYDGGYDRGYDRGYERSHDRDYDRGHDDRRGSWQNINARQAQLDHRIERGLRNGTLSRAEAARLRAEFRAIARLESRYRVNGLNNWERADLDRRFDRLSAQIRMERRDRDYGYGYGYGQRR